MDDIRLECSGLYLDPSELTAPAGSLREALNVRIKRQNTIEPRPGFPITSLTGPSGAGWQAFSWSGEAYGVFNTKLWRDESPAVEILRITGITYTGGPPAVSYSTTSLVMSSDTSYAEQMGRNFYVITDGGVVRVADPSDDTCVYAGMPVGPPPLGVATGATTHHFAMRTVIVQTVNGQLLVGAPSAAAVFVGEGGAELTVNLNQYGLLPGMRLQVYATEPVVVATPTGDEMRLVYDIELTNQQWILGAGDPTLSLAINPYLNGASLYTNETQEGIAQASYAPRRAKCMAAFKGMAFYGDLLPEYDYTLEGTTGDGTSPARVMAIGSEYEQLLGTATIGSPVIQFLTSFIGDYLTGCYVSQDGIVGTAGTIIPADARIIAVSTGGALGTDTITLDKNALASGAIPILYVHDVLTVDGEEFINGVLSDTPNRQFGSRSDLVALVAAHTDVRLEVSSNDEDPYTLLWQSNASFSISYQPRLTNGTLVGLYGVSAVTSSAADADRSRVMWSKTLQPEAVPRLNFQDIGAWREPVLRMVPTRDSLFVLKADGVWRITGESPETLRVEEFDRTIQLIHRRAADLYDNQVLAWTSNGIVAISEAGAQRMSEPAIGVALADSQENIITLGLSAPPGGVFITGCTNQECVLVGVPSSTATGANATAEYIYAYEGKTGAWVRWTPLTNIDWRGAVEHVGRMVLVGEANEDASLMYQDDDNSDAEAAVTVTLASATQATILELGSTGVGHRITQGSVVAWLTAALGSAAYTTTAELSNDAATAAAPMTCVVEWNASPTPGTMSHWRQMRGQFASLVQVWRVRFGFTSERVQPESEVYQDFTSPQTEQGVTALRMYVTRAQARCARLRPRITIASAGQSWLLNGITLTFEPMRDGNRLP